MDRQDLQGIRVQASIVSTFNAEDGPIVALGLFFASKQHSLLAVPLLRLLLGTFHGAVIFSYWRNLWPLLPSSHYPSLYPIPEVSGGA
jgi:hypothetical protein